MFLTKQLAIMFFGGLRIFLGLFFLVVGAMKAVKVDQLAADIVRFDIMPPGYEWYLACLGVAVELGLGMCLLAKRLYWAATFAGCLLTFCFVAIFLQAWIRGLELSCNCLGVAREATNYPFEIGWRMLLVVGMLALWWEARHRNSAMFKVGRLDLSGVD